MKVFIVLHGERCEGGSVVSVHKTHKGAVKAALGQEYCFKGGWVKEDEDEWLNGFDFIKVKEHKVI